MSTTTYILNRCPTKELDGITLEECWFSVKPSLSHLKVFRSIAYRHALDQLKRKLIDKLELDDINMISFDWRL